MRFSRVDPDVFGTLLALAETAIAVGLLSGAFTTAVCAAGGALSLMIWSTGEGFGGPYGDGTTDIGASLVYVPRSSRCSPSSVRAESGASTVGCGPDSDRWAGSAVRPPR